MRLRQIKLENFRGYKDETTIDIDELTVFVGRNDAGKSSIFDALEIFFEGKKTPDKDDACVHGDPEKVRITCIFEDFPEELIIDTQRATSLSDEHMLNSDGFLEITRVYNCALKTPKDLGVWAKANHPSADNYSDLLALTNTKLKSRASSLDVDLDGVNQVVNVELRRAIWNHADDLQLQEAEVELKSEAAKAIWDQLKKHLPVFAIFKSDRPSTDQDAEAQDPMKAAIKEAVKEQEEAFKDIYAKVEEEVQDIARRTVEKLSEMSPELASQLTPRVSHKKLDTLFNVSLTGDDDIPINKRGSGTRRLLLLNFFRAKIEKEATVKNGGVIYAIEEPETSQHPNNQIMLVNALAELAEKPDCQVLLTTHTPTLARRFPQPCLRLVSQGEECPTIQPATDEQVVSAIVDSLGVLPDHNIKVFMGVEGRNDINFFRAISKVLHLAGETDIPNLEEAEQQGHLVFVPLGGSSLDLWVSRLKGLNRTEFYIMDRDTEPPAPPHYQAREDEFNQRENCTAWHTGKRELENYIHKDLIVAEYASYAGAGSAFENVPNLLAQAIHEASDSDSTWADVCTDPAKLKKKESRAKKALNTVFASKMTPDLLTNVDTDDDVRGWLRAIGTALQA